MRLVGDVLLLRLLDEDVVARFMECGEFLSRQRYLLMLRMAVYSGCVWPAILYGSAACCQKESEPGIL